MEEILRLFPEEIRYHLKYCIKDRWFLLQEIRIRFNQPIELVFDHKVEWVQSINLNQKDKMFIINQMSDFSLYRMEDELREGYITIEGGHRVGIAGKVNTVNGSVKAIQYITFLNIRIAKEKLGVAEPFISFLYNNQYLNTLLIGPPQTGKTTLIRDITRVISSGWNGIPGQKLGVIDERSEIGASLNGVPQHNLGRRTDVLDACPKAEGMMMLIRSMSPDVIVIDEIGSQKDVEALLEAINAGVTIICTVHGESLEEIHRRPSMQLLFKQQIFRRFILLDRKKQPGTIKSIFNEKKQLIFSYQGA